jgi:hypothetical protein
MPKRFLEDPSNPYNKIPKVYTDERTPRSEGETEKNFHDFCKFLNRTFKSHGFILKGSREGIDCYKSVDMYIIEIAPYGPSQKADALLEIFKKCPSCLEFKITPQNIIKIAISDKAVDRDNNNSVPFKKEFIKALNSAKNENSNNNDEMNIDGKTRYYKK